MRDWDGGEKVWAQIADNAPRPPGWSVGFQRSYAAAQAVQIIPGLGLPSIFLLLLFMMGYIVLIGPVNYLFVWRIKRRELAWLTIPAIILLSSAGMYLVGTQLMGRAVTVNQMSVAFGHMDSDAMRVESLTTLYSPRRVNYDITMPGGALARPFTQGYYGGSGIGQGGNVAAMERDAQLIARQTRVDVGGLQNFTARYHQPRPALSGRVNLSVQSGGAAYLDVYLQNNEGWTLQNAALIYGDAVYPLGDLTAGGSYEGRQTARAITGSVSGAYTPYAYYSSPSASVLTGNAEHLIGSSNYWSDQKLFARYQLLEAISPDYGGSGVGHLPVGVATLTGWRSDSELQLPFNPGANQVKAYNNVLYFLEIPVTHTITESNFRLPRAMLTWRVLNSEGMGGMVGAPPFSMFTGLVDYEFEPVFQPNNGEISRLEIVLESGLLTSGDPPNIYLWNWSAEQWDRANVMDWGLTAVADHEPYIGSNFTVRLRLENGRPFSYEIEEFYPALYFR
jgi:hypothetical protein